MWFEWVYECVCKEGKGILLRTWELEGKLPNLELRVPEWLKIRMLNLLVEEGNGRESPRPPLWSSLFKLATEESQRQGRWGSLKHLGRTRQCRLPRGCVEENVLQGTSNYHTYWFVLPRPLQIGISWNPLKQTINCFRKNFPGGGIKTKIPRKKKKFLMFSTDCSRNRRSDVTQHKVMILGWPKTFHRLKAQSHTAHTDTPRWTSVLIF